MNVPQFTATFPSSLSQLTDFFPVIEKLFMFRSSIEQIAHKLNNSIRTSLDKQLESNLQNVMGSPERVPPSVVFSPPLYFTPPRRDINASIIPKFTVRTANDSISEDFSDGSGDGADGEPDRFGFVLCRSGLYKHVTSNQTMKHHYLCYLI